MAARPSIHDHLGRGASDSVLCTKLTLDEARLSGQLYYVLVLPVTGRALDKVQGAGEGEGCLVRPCTNSGNLAHGAGSRYAAFHPELQVHWRCSAASDVFVNTKALTGSSSKRSSTLSEPRSLTARPQPAAPWRWMLFVVNKERAEARRRARTRARVKTTARRRRTLRTLARPRRKRRNAFTARSSGTGSRSVGTSQQTRPSQLRKDNRTTSTELGAAGSGPPKAAPQVSAWTVSGRDPEVHVCIFRGLFGSCFPCCTTRSPRQSAQIHARHSDTGRLRPSTETPMEPGKTFQTETRDAPKSRRSH